MSDPKYGDPVDDAAPADEVTPDDAVARAHEGLAEAEAAAEATDETPDGHQVSWPAATPAADEHDGLSAADAALYEQAMAEAALGDHEPAHTTPERYEAPALSGKTGDGPAVEQLSLRDEGLAETRVVPSVVPPEPVAETQVFVPTPQPIFVQAPEPPLPRGNRGAAGAIGLLAAIAFGVLYLGAALGLGALNGDVTGANLGTEALAALTSWWFWVPVAVFFIAFWLLGAIINRGRWGYWVHFGLLVGAASYGGHILGQLFQAPFWTLTASQGAEIANDQLLAPLAIAAFVIGREVTIWFGAWVAARGKRVSELNYEAQREYERTLEAGPRIQQG